MDRVNVLIVGAGVTGLTCAVALARLEHMNVTVLERSARISDKGNGIQIPCNATRVLQQLGVLEDVLEHAGGPATATMSLDYRNGNTMLSRDFTACAEIYKTPWILIHRGAYLRVLYQKALKLGVTFRFDCRVSHVHTQDRPKVELGNEEVLEAHLIVACDGLHSKIRSTLFPLATPTSTGFTAYRATYDAKDLDAKHLEGRLDHLKKPGVCFFWLAPGIQIVFYALQAPAEDLSLGVPDQIRTIYNLVVVEENKLDQRYRDIEPLSLQRLRETLVDWDPAIHDLLGLAQHDQVFAIDQIKDLSDWSRGAVVMMGDAVHAMLPHLGQGAAMCVEDAYVFSEVLSLFMQHEEERYAENICAAIRMFKELRLARTSQVAAKSAEAGRWQQNMEVVSLPMGTEVDESNCEVSWAWINSPWNKELLAYDGKAAANEAYQKSTALKGSKHLA